MDKIAVIDLGSNSARLILAYVLPNGSFVIFDELKEAVRLAQDMERDGFLKQTRIDQAIRTLKMFRKLCDSSGVENIRAFATNAVRRAKNQKSFLEEVNTVCGFKLRVLSEEEESGMIYNGVINTLDVPKGVIMDLSGSGLEIIQYNRRNILNHASFPFGTMTLTSMFNEEGVSPEQIALKIENFARDSFSSLEWLKEIEPEYQFVGVGGSFRNLAKIVMRLNRYPLDTLHNFQFGINDFDNVYNVIKATDVNNRTRIRGLSAERADIFSAALSCIKGFLGCTNFDHIVISGSGIREGCILYSTVPTTLDKPITDILNFSINSKMHYYGLNAKHAEHVCALSVLLYKQLRVLHKLPRQYLRILKIAALLSDAGNRINYYDHHRHAFYMILNSNLYGISHRETVLAAFVARCDKIDDFNRAEYNRYASILREEDMIAVIKLSVILRIAQSLDRSLSSAVTGLNCDILGDSVIMKTEVEGDCSLEIKDALRTGGDFAKIFKKNLEII